MWRHRWARKIFWVALALLFLSIVIPPVVTLNYWQKEVSMALSQELGRPVHVGQIRLKLLGGLGFEIENVVVEENPDFGVEPFARMEALRATVALRWLLRNQIQFSTLVFVHPSLNVVRNPAGRWNLESLWGHSGVSAQRGLQTSPIAAAPFQTLPRIRVESGRINFKSDNLKKVYIVDSLDLGLFPPTSSEQPWRLQFEGRPNRTDFQLPAVSQFRGRAEFGPFSSSIREETGMPVRLDLFAEDALLGDLLKTFTGNDYGLHGSLNLRFHLAGTSSLLRLSGTAEVRDLHRWDLLPPTLQSPLHAEIAGLLDLGGDSLQLTSLSIPLSRGSVVVQGGIERLFHHPQPDLRIRLNQVSVETIVEIARQFTTRLDTRLIAQGTLDGRVQMEGTPRALAGSVEITGGSFRKEGTSKIARLSDFRIVLEGRRGRLGPVRINLDQGNEVGISAEWDLEKRSSVIHLHSETVPLVSFSQWAQVFGSPWGDVNFARGKMALQVDVTTEAGIPPKIRGWAQISGAALNSTAGNQPIRISAARMQFQAGQIAVRSFSAALGEMEIHGSFLARFSAAGMSTFPTPSNIQTIEFDCQASKIDIDVLNQFLSPRYSPVPFFRFGNDTNRDSSYYNNLVTRGTVQADSISYRGIKGGHFKASVDFRNRLLEIKKFSGELAGGNYSGEMTLHLGQEAPLYTVQGTYSNVDLPQLMKESSFGGGFFSGKLSGNLRLASSGQNLKEILEHLGGSGEVTGRNLTVNGLDLTRKAAANDRNPGTLISSFSSTFQVAKKEVLITDLKITLAARSIKDEENEKELPLWIASGAIGFDRKLDLIVKKRDGREQYHWVGTLSEPRIIEIISWLPPTR